MCAMMPMFRVFANEDCLAISFELSAISGQRTATASCSWALLAVSFSLPTIVRERLVRLRHAVRVFALLHGAAAEVGGVEQLVRQLLLHRLAVAARGGVADDPADAQRQPSIRIHFDRHLVVRAADAARLHFEARLDVVDRLLEDLQRIVGGLFLDDVEALVKDALRRAALAVAHHAVDELGDKGALIERIGWNLAFGNDSSTWHISEPLGL